MKIDCLWDSRLNEAEARKILKDEIFYTFLAKNT